MQNFLILYNPYYKRDVIEAHLEILRDNGKVAFGKIRSKLKNELGGDSREFLGDDFLGKAFCQLFLSDYANLFVAKVTQITRESCYHFAPKYYAQDALEVECWFVLEDLRELVRDDFATLRDKFLANFTTPAHGNHTYAIYGNSYIYPLEVRQKREICYFEGSEKHFIDIFKSDEFLDIKNRLKSYCLGDFIYDLHPDSLDDVISAEMEFLAHSADKTHDFSSIIVKYSKSCEREIYSFMRFVFGAILSQNRALEEITYSVQQRQHSLRDILSTKPNLGTYAFLLRNERINSAIRAHFPRQSYVILSALPKFIALLQNIRNESLHATKPTFSDVMRLRNAILGVGESSAIVEMLKARK